MITFLGIVLVLSEDKFPKPYSSIAFVAGVFLILFGDKIYARRRSKPKRFSPTSWWSPN